MIDIKSARELFPHIGKGSVYFNHASSGPISLFVREALQQLITEKSEENIDDFNSFLKTADETRQMLGELVNCAPSRIAFTDNTTNGIIMLANSVQWNPGDRILLNDLEFPANVYPFLNLKKQGVEVDVVPSHNGIVSAEDIIDQVRPGTRLISVSQVQFLTGYRADLQKIGEFCRKNNIIFAVDAIQGLGAVPLDVVNDKIDFISSGSQKWLLGLQGFAFIYISEELQQSLSQSNVGWLSVVNAWNLLDYDLKLRGDASALQTGTVNTFGVYALNASLKLFRTYSHTEVHKHVLMNTQLLMESLEKIGVEPILSGCAPQYLSGIVSFRHPEAQKILDQLSERKIYSAVREGIVRLSPHFYNDETDIAAAVSAINSVIRQL